MKRRPYTLDSITRLVIGIAITIVIIYLMIYVRTALIPFFMAWFIAYLINPIVLFVQDKLHIRSKIVSVIIVLSVIFALISAFAWAFIPRIIDEIAKGIDLFNESNLPERINEGLAKLKITTDMATKGLSVVSQVIDTSLSTVYAILGLFVTLIYLIFILKDFEVISNGALSLIPLKYRERSSVVIEDVKEGMNRYFRGQALVALCVGILLSIGFSIISLPMGIILGLFIGMLNFVPYLQVVGIAPMVIVSLLQSSNSGDSFWLVFGSALLVLAIVQTIQDLFLVPKIMGRVTGLNPAIILLSLSIWGILLGVIGMIIALPLTTLLLSYYKRFIVMDNGRAKEAEKPNMPSIH